MRRTFLLAVILTAMLPLCAQENKLTGLRRTLTEHYSADAEKRRAAAWLLDNMPYHGTVRSPQQDECYNRLTAIEHNTVCSECAHYILHDLTKDREECIFAYERGEVIVVKRRKEVALL